MGACCCCEDIEEYPSQQRRPTRAQTRPASSQARAPTSGGGYHNVSGGQTSHVEVDPREFFARFQHHLNSANTTTGGAGGASGGNATTGLSQQPRNASQCQYCGNSFDPSLLDGHQETCRINLKKKATEIRGNNGQQMQLRVFELNSANEYDDDAICVVCMNALRSYAIVPCGHLIACGLCAKQLETCPMCRKERQGLLFVDPTTELKTTCKHCKNVIHPAYFDGHREVCSLQMRQLAQQIQQEKEAAEAAATVSSYPTQESSPGGGANSSPPIRATQVREDEQAPGKDANNNNSFGNGDYSSRSQSEQNRPQRDHGNDNEATPLLQGDTNFVGPTSATDAPIIEGLTLPTTDASLATKDADPSPMPLTSPAANSNSHASPSRHNLCVECRSNAIEVALIPCGHSCLCAACGARTSMCPICYTSVERCMQTFK